MERKNKINVLIVDDDNLLIDGIEKFFKESEYLNCLDRANNPDECLIKLEQYSTDVDIILMDVLFRKFKINGIELARNIRVIYPGTKPKIAFMSISNKGLAEPENGFHGLIPKNQGMLELIEMLKDIHYNDTVFPILDEEENSFFDKLTPRQQKIFCLILNGSKIEDVANQLNINFNTINSHQKAIISKIKEFGFEINKLNDPKVLNFAKLNNLCN